MLLADLILVWWRGFFPWRKWITSK